MRAFPLPLSIAAGALLLAACSGDTAGPGADGHVTVNLATTSSNGTALRSDTLVSGNDTLLLEQVQIVLRDIKFERVNDCDDDDDDHDDDLRGVARSGDDDDEDDDWCEYANAGPYLLDLPLGPGVERAFTVPVMAGSYDELDIKIHKPEDNGTARDREFIAQHPEFNKISIRATGTFNGAPFTFESDITAKQEIDLVPPLVVSDSSLTADVTLRVAISDWFRVGGSLVDPTLANKGGVYANDVRDNIRDSFRAFRDDDRDGDDDDHDDWDDD